MAPAAVSEPAAASLAPRLTARPAAAPVASSPAAPTTSAAPVMAAAAVNHNAPRFQTGSAAQHRAAAADPELAVVKGMLRGYRAAFGQNPVGTNREITSALLGKNSRGLSFRNRDGDAAAPRLDERGRLLDRWGHPYFFHQLSATALEVRSAGPDGALWTADDEVTR